MGCMMGVVTSWPPDLPVEKIPMMTEDEVILVQVAWQRLEKVEHMEDVIVCAFRKLFLEHPSALKLFVRERRKNIEASASNSQMVFGNHHHLHLLHRKMLLVDFQRRHTLETFSEEASMEGSKDNSPSKHTIVNNSRQHSGEETVSNASTGHSPCRFYEWLPDCMFQLRQYSDNYMAEDPEKEFHEHGDVRWLNHHFKRVAMVMHHIVYVLHEPMHAQKWLSALRIGHSTVPGIVSGYYKSLMVFMEMEIGSALGEKFYCKKVKTAMRKFLTVLFGYLAGHGMSFEPTNLTPETSAVSELESDILIF